MGDVIDFVRDLLLQYGYIIVFLLAAGDNFGIPAAGDVVLLAASAIAAESDELSWRIVVAVAIAGGLTADNVGYCIGRFGGGPLVRRFTPKRVRGSIEKRFHSHAGKTVTTARMLAGFRAAVPIFAGTSEMPYRKFVVFNTAGVIIWAFSVGTIGYVFSKSLTQVAEVVSQGSKLAALVVFLILAISITVAVVRHRRKRMRRS